MKLNEIIELSKRVAKAKESNVLGFTKCLFTNQTEVQVNEEFLLDHIFGNIISKTARACDLYPVELSFEFEGAKFFTVLSEQEYESKFKQLVEGGNNNERIANAI